jgi:GNAT superfamily N-acetyltransferase
MSHFWQGLARQQTPDRFMPMLRHVTKPPPHPDLRFELCDQAHIPEVTAFLTQHFSSHSKSHPILHPTLSPSLNEIILIARDQTDLLVGCIRYKYSGELEGQPIHCFDCFCVHPSYRGTGLASRLLLEIHEYTNRLGKRYSIFLKEGRPVPSVSPFYSSTYVYKAVTVSNRSNQLVKQIKPELASRLVSVYQQFHPDTFWIHSVKNPNQSWYLYKTERQFLLVCLQDSFQTFQGQRIGWLTACFRSGSVSIDTILGSVSGYGWIWMDKSFLRDEEGWLEDGPFHWYSYQWTSCLRPDRSYGIVV